MYQRELKYCKVKNVPETASKRGSDEAGSLGESEVPKKSRMGIKASGEHRTLLPEGETRLMRRANLCQDLLPDCFQGTADWFLLPDLAAAVGRWRWNLERKSA